MSDTEERCEYCGKLMSEHRAEEADAKRLAEIAELTAYLASTDWYAIRMAETGKAIPDSVAKERALERMRISELREANKVSST